MFNWDEYIQLGKEFLNKSEERYKRLGVSRIYYGIYNLAKRKIPLSDQQALKRSDTSHVDMWNSFFCQENDDEFLRKVDILKQARNVADYESSSHKFKVNLDGFKKQYKYIEKEVKSRPKRA